jgi:uncharacterized protein
MDFNKKIAEELSLGIQQVRATIHLLSEGATVPFVARYRKEATGSLDEVAIATIRDLQAQYMALEKRREAILHALKESKQLTDNLEGAIKAADTLSRLEDIYLPYKPKRRTRATMAREKGLEPLAHYLYHEGGAFAEQEAQHYVNLEKGVATTEEALHGACDIIAEWLHEDAAIRAALRGLFQSKGIYKCKVITGKEDAGIKFKDYFQWEEAVSKAPSHRVLAMRRGEEEGILALECAPPDEEALYLLESKAIQPKHRESGYIRKAIHDGYKRLMKPSMETELRMESKRKADEEAIQVFADNLRQLLLASPLGDRPVLAIDPGFRTGCKVAMLDAQGVLLEYTTVFPHDPQKRLKESAASILQLLERYSCEVIAVGNGTAGRETEQWLHTIPFATKPTIVSVNESGASIYSASEAAREEFPNLDLTYRGAVSIGRRLKDPLAELVKIDPKSIGVGQYQHDVDQGKLRHSLDDVVISCVNAVGVELNTASKHLLTYVSGLGAQLAANIVDYRNQNGPFSSRESLKEVPRLGQKAYEQCAGFLRIRQSAHPLDRSAVHPERYSIVAKMADDAGCSLEELMASEERRRQIKLSNYVTEDAGMPTLQDIMQELAKPGRDPRSKYEAIAFAEGVHSPEDLKPGMKLTGVVTNVTNFGAFVDIGVHQDGLVHISQLSDRYIKHPSEAVQVAQKVEVTVMEVDLLRKRISLSMKKETTARPGKDAAIKSVQQQPEGELQAKLSQLKGKFSR